MTILLEEKLAVQSERINELKRQNETLLGEAADREKTLNEKVESIRDQMKHEKGRYTDKVRKLKRDLKSTNQLVQ